MLSSSFKATGKGEIDLLQQTIDLLIKAYYTRSEKTKNTEIPIKISGQLTNPKVSVEAGSTVISQLANSENLENIKKSIANIFN
mgnify:CR=1 FL=1